MKRVASPLVNAPEIVAGVPFWEPVSGCLGTAQPRSVRFRDRPAGAAAPKPCTQAGAKTGGLLRLPLAFGVHGVLHRPRCGGDGRPLPLPHQGREAAAPLAISPSSCTARRRACGSPAPLDGAPEPNVISGSTRLNVHPPIDATRDWAVVRLAAPACKAGAFKVSAKPVTEVMKLSAKGQVFNIAYHRDLPKWQPMLNTGCGVQRDFDDADWTHDPPRFHRPRSAAAAHLRHGRRLVGLAAARRRPDTARRSSASTSAPTCSRR